MRKKTARSTLVEKAAARAPGESFQTSQHSAVEGRAHGVPDRKRRPKLRQLDAKDVDAVFAEDPGAINSLRDVQVHRYLKLFIALRSCFTRMPSVLTVA